MGAGLAGIVVKGSGEGRYYMGLKQYRLQFRKKLGFMPYQGTLNIKADKNKISNFLESRVQIRIKGFKSGLKTFFGLRCYKVKLKENMIALLIPDKTLHNSEIIELIAPFSIKRKFGLKQGGRIIIK